jgi:hypothetical protein
VPNPYKIWRCGLENWLRLISDPYPAVLHLWAAQNSGIFELLAFDE